MVDFVPDPVGDTLRVSMAHPLPCIPLPHPPISLPINCLPVASIHHFMRNVCTHEMMIHAPLSGGHVCPHSSTTLSWSRSRSAPVTCRTRGGTSTWNVWLPACCHGSRTVWMPRWISGGLCACVCVCVCASVCVCVCL